jgi:hypothetical protein
MIARPRDGKCSGKSTGSGDKTTPILSGHKAPFVAIDREVKSISRRLWEFLDTDLID